MLALVSPCYGPSRPRHPRPGCARKSRWAWSIGRPRIGWRPERWRCLDGRPAGTPSRVLLASPKPPQGRGQDDRQAQFPSLSANRARAPVPNHGERPRAQRADRPRRRRLASHAAVGSVYFDTNGNAAAGEILFNGTFTGCYNVGLGRSVMPNLTTGAYNVATGTGALFSNTTGSQQRLPTGFEATAPVDNTTGGDNVAIGSGALAANTDGTSTSRPATTRWTPTPPAPTTSPPAPSRWPPTPPATDNVATGPRRPAIQHHRQQQRRQRPKRPRWRTRPATTTSPPASTP